jgi:hypothetical protein
MVVMGGREAWHVQIDPSTLLYALGLALVAPLLLLPLAAQPVQPMPTASTPVAVVLATAPHHDISNMLITARLGTSRVAEDILSYRPQNARIY